MHRLWLQLSSWCCSLKFPSPSLPAKFVENEFPISFYSSKNTSTQILTLWNWSFGEFNLDVNQFRSIICSRFSRGKTLLTRERVKLLAKCSAKKVSTDPPLYAIKVSYLIISSQSYSSMVVILHVWYLNFSCCFVQSFSFFKSSFCI